MEVLLTLRDSERSYSGVLEDCWECRDSIGTILNARFLRHRPRRGEREREREGESYILLILFSRQLHDQQLSNRRGGRPTEPTDAMAASIQFIFNDDCDDPPESGPKL